MAKRTKGPAGPGDNPESDDAATEVERHLNDMEGANVRCMRGLNALLRDVSQAEGVTIPQLLYDMLRNPLKARFLANYDRIKYQREKRDSMGVPKSPE